MVDKVISDKMDSAKKPSLTTVQMREALAKLEKGNPSIVKKKLRLTTKQQLEELAKLPQANADTRDVMRRCQRCGLQFSHKPSKKGKIVGALVGAAAGATRVVKGGFVGGRISTIARIAHSIVQGAVSGSITGGHFDKPVCPKCSARFE